MVLRLCNVSMALVLSLALFALPAVAAQAHALEVEPVEGQVCGEADVVLVLDRSGSMGGSALASAKSAAKTFVDVLNVSSDQAASASFASSASLQQGLTNNFTAVKDAIDGITSGGSTCIACGIDVAQDELDANGRATSNHVIVLLSDGSPNVGDTLVAASAAKAKGTTIFTVGIGGADVSLMQDIASEEDFFIFGTEDELEGIYTQIAGEVCALPDPDEPVDQVPEFGALAAVGILAAAGLFIYRRRR